MTNNKLPISVNLPGKYKIYNSKGKLVETCRLRVTVNETLKKLKKIYLGEEFEVEIK